MNDNGLFIEDLPETLAGRPGRTATLLASGPDEPTTSQSARRATATSKGGGDRGSMNRVASRMSPSCGVESSVGPTTHRWSLSLQAYADSTTSRSLSIRRAFRVMSS